MINPNAALALGNNIDLKKQRKIREKTGETFPICSGRDERRAA